MAVPCVRISGCTQAVESEGIDLLTVTVSGELPISKEIEELLKVVRSHVYIYRNKETSAPQAKVNSLVSEDA